MVGAYPTSTEARAEVTAPLAKVLVSLSWTLRQFATHPERFYQVLKVFLESLRHATKMDAAELFLADPQRQWLNLTSYGGIHLEAFAERPSFAWGEGYPGLVAARGAPLVTHALSEDPRYLRSKVKALGYHTYVCFPLSLGEHFIGVINLASRDPEADEGLALELLEVVAP
jgi:transcriptional regulator with GAF, ATPase, and Fis domain